MSFFTKISVTIRAVLLLTRAVFGATFGLGSLLVVVREVIGATIGSFASLLVAVRDVKWRRSCL